MTFVSIQCNTDNSANISSTSYGYIVGSRNNVTTTEAKKTVYVKSTMPKKEGQWHLFIGRWQSLKLGHKKIFEQILKDGGNVCIAIRNGEIDKKNPLTANEVYENIKEEYKNNIHLFKNLLLVIVPDVSSVDFGRGIGYDIVEYIPPAEISEISSAKILEQIKSIL